jgi:hypothetical protein
MLFVLGQGLLAYAPVLNDNDVPLFEDTVPGTAVFVSMLTVLFSAVNPLPVSVTTVPGTPDEGEMEVIVTPPLVAPADTDVDVVDGVDVVLVDEDELDPEEVSALKRACKSLI